MVQGSFDRVHVGATCPEKHLPRLVDLLAPDGLMVVPVAPSDLRLIRVHPNGEISQRIISQVRYGDLEVRAETWSRSRRICGTVVFKSGPRRFEFGEWN